jgi:Arc/MetJ-type ribon-helix-helix transcriptional regulator
MIAHELHMTSGGVEMTAKTVGFAIADEDRERLAVLVEHFGNGNRSEFLRVAMTRLQRDMLVERMRSLQARARDELGGRVVPRDEVTMLVKQTLHDRT